MKLTPQNIHDLEPGQTIFIAKSFQQPISYEYVGDTKAFTLDLNMYFIPVIGPHFMVNKSHPEVTLDLCQGNVFTTLEECVSRCRDLSLKTIENFNNTLFSKNPILVS